jgi:3-deoxy-D-manno-octulosonate 8-phosphate phosphatase (KDO 8-P phosphatase)
VKELHIQHAYLGQENKLPAFEDLKQKLNLPNEAIAYMGDDLPDLPILKRVGLAMTVSEAPELIRQKVHYIAKKPAGGGAVREACEFILGAQDKLAAALASYDI